VLLAAAGFVHDAAAQAPDVRSLVRFAYFTDAPPAPGTIFRALEFDEKLGVFTNDMPPHVREFPADAPVTFFYGLTSTERALKITLRWIAPDGTVSGEFGQTLDQSAFKNTSWFWLMQTMPGPHQPGEWALELLLEGQRVDRYTFRVRDRS
jgi:hypothetical protein